jgi:hypothetical protein
MKNYVSIVIFLVLKLTINGQGFNHVETWSREGNVLKGFGLAMEGRDTLFFERVEIDGTLDSPVYTSWVAHQNNGAGIRFSLKSATDTSWIFENPNHDFPQQIIYIRKESDQLEAYVSGRENGIKRKEHFVFKRY